MHNNFSQSNIAENGGLKSIICVTFKYGIIFTFYLIKP